MVDGDGDLHDRITYGFANENNTPTKTLANQAHTKTQRDEIDVCEIGRRENTLNTKHTKLKTTKNRKHVHVVMPHASPHVCVCETICSKSNYQKIQGLPFHLD